MAVLNQLDKTITQVLGDLTVDGNEPLWGGSETQYVVGPLEYPELFVYNEPLWEVGPLVYDDYVASGVAALNKLAIDKLVKTYATDSANVELNLGNTDTIIPIGQGTLDKAIPGYNPNFPEHTYSPGGGGGGGNASADDKVLTTEELAKKNVNPKTQAVQPIKDGGFTLLSKNEINGNKIDPNKGFNIPSNAAFRMNADDKFYILYKDRRSGTPKRFTFDLLPAMENRGGSKFGNIEVPEVKPGILQRIDTKHKNIVIPGSTPVVQTIGINNAMLNLIGAMTGEEVIGQGKSADEKSSSDVLLSSYEITDQFDKHVSANKQAKQFMDEVVLPGTEVEVYVSSSNNGASAPTAKEGPEEIKYTGVIISYKFYGVRKNKAFYTIDLLVTKYI